jgi:hypothetical protein
MRVKRNSRAIGLLLVSVILLSVSVAQLLNNPVATLEAMGEVFAY